MKEDFGVKMMKVLRIKIKPYNFDLCDDCIKEFKKFLGKKDSKWTLKIKL